MIRKPIFFIPTFLALIIILFNLFKFYNENYEFNENNLIKIDSIKLLDRAYILRTRNHIQGFDFRDINGATIRISGEEYHSLADPRWLWDTLQYSGTVLCVWTTQKGKKIYDKGFSMNRVHIKQVAIGGNLYVDTKKVAMLKERSRLNLIFFTAIAYIFYILANMLSKADNPKTSRAFSN